MASNLKAASLPPPNSPQEKTAESKHLKTPSIQLWVLSISPPAVGALTQNGNFWGTHRIIQLEGTYKIESICLSKQAFHNYSVPLRWLSSLCINTSHDGANTIKFFLMFKQSQLRTQPTGCPGIEEEVLPLCFFPSLMLCSAPTPHQTSFWSHSMAGMSERAKDYSPL